MKTLINTFWQSSIVNGSSFLRTESAKRTRFLIQLVYFFIFISSLQTFSTFTQFPHWDAILDSKHLFDPIWSAKWIPTENWELSVRTIILSLLACSTLGVIAWSRSRIIRLLVFLSLFSWWGLARLLPQLLHNLYYYDWQVNLCANPYSLISETAGMWGFFFLLSKFAELFDTFFIVVHKKPLLFLHWYHHIMTMLYCWYANQEGVAFNCSGMFFATMNLCVHSVMYLYYALAAAGFAKTMAKYNLNVVLTTGQIVQMFGGVIILYKSVNCQKFDQRGFVIGTVMYTSYLLLFCKLFVDKYHKKFRGLCPCTSRGEKIKSQ